MSVTFPVAKKTMNNVIDSTEWDGEKNLLFYVKFKSMRAIGEVSV